MQVETIPLGKARRDASPQSPHSFDPEARIDVKDVGALIGYKSQSPVYEKVAAGELPPPVIRTHRFTRWRRGDIIDFLRAEVRHERVAASTGHSSRCS
jgi:predicted DNA-binding transcriptional regulator AlpA